MIRPILAEAKACLSQSRMALNFALMRAEYALDYLEEEDLKEAAGQLRICAARLSESHDHARVGEEYLERLSKLRYDGEVRRLTRHLTRLRGYMARWKKSAEKLAEMPEMLSKPDLEEFKADIKRAFEEMKGVEEAVRIRWVREKNGP